MVEDLLAAAAADDFDSMARTYCIGNMNYDGRYKIDYSYHID
jgi:hypothetical protein